MTLPIKILILTIRPTRWTNFSNLFWNETLYVSDNFFVHHQDYYYISNYIILPIMSCETERNFSKLSTITSKLLSNTLEEKLNYVSILPI